MLDKKGGSPDLRYILLNMMVVFLYAVATAHAHGVYVFARVEGDRILTESYFSDERKIKDGVIKVYAPSGKLILEGKTDEKGLFSFRVPQKTDLKIVLEASMGHRAEFVLQTDELAGRVSAVKHREGAPGLLQAGEGVGIILLMIGLFYFGRRKWGLKLKKEKGQ
jgi:nickel transport protein